MTTENTMAKLIMMSGLPASGKSTKAKELIESMGNAIRVNKDLFRTMLHFDKWTGMNESHTRAAETAVAREFLRCGINVIVDDTNLGQSHIDSWKNIAKDMDAKFERVHLNTKFTECVIRDAKRYGSPGHVGAHVIKQMALQYDMVDPPMKGYVFCDLDGTLADIKHRLSFVRSSGASVDFKKDWKGFSKAIPGDILRLDVAKEIQELYRAGYTIILISARPENYREKTESWLSKFENRIYSDSYPELSGEKFKYFTLIMRRAGDKRPDTEVKQQILDTYFKDKKHLIFKVYDDRPSVIRMWESNGLKVEDVVFTNRVLITKLLKIFVNQYMGRGRLVSLGHIEWLNAA